MTVGWWQTDYWQNSASGEYWQDDYWQDYGFVSGGGGSNADSMHYMGSRMRKRRIGRRR